MEYRAHLMEYRALLPDHTSSNDMAEPPCEKMSLCRWNVGLICQDTLMESKALLTLHTRSNDMAEHTIES